MDSLFQKSLRPFKHNRSPFQVHRDKQSQQQKVRHNVNDPVVLNSKPVSKPAPKPAKKLQDSSSGTSCSHSDENKLNCGSTKEKISALKKPVAARPRPHAHESIAAARKLAAATSSSKSNFPAVIFVEKPKLAEASASAIESKPVVHSSQLRQPHVSVREVEVRFSCLELFVVNI